VNSDLDNAAVKSHVRAVRLAGRETVTATVRVIEKDQTAETAGKGDASAHETKHWAADWMVLSAVLLISAIYVGLHIGSGWVPADEGTLGQSALRVMQGQLPHRDFTEIYTGGLSLIHAAAFRTLGVNLMSLRICVFVFFLAWVSAVYYIARRFWSAPGAGLITLLAVSWSFPNYPAAMPSWYNLFFATFGALALLRYLEVGQRRWLFVAGLCGGVSILIKVIGTYYIAGVLLFLAYLEQSAHQDLPEQSPKDGRAISYLVFSTSSLLLFAATVIYMVHTRLGSGELYNFVLPSVALVTVIFLSERSVSGVRASARFRALFRLVIPFGCGVAIPIVMFLIPYARSGAMGAFFSGVTSSAVSRSLGLGMIRPQGAESSIYALALLGLVAAAMYLREVQGWIVGAAVGVGLALMLYKSSQLIVSGVWISAATLTPLIVLSGMAILGRSQESNSLTLRQRQQVMLLISLAGLCSLVQYPFAAPIYLSYSLPLTLLAAAAIVSTVKKQPGTYVLASVAVFYLLFGVVRLVPDYIYDVTHKVGAMEQMHFERSGGLRVEFGKDVDGFVQFLQQHSPNGLIYAGNDCPEFYFLTGLKNVIRDDGGAPKEETLKAVQMDELNLVVINDSPFFPGAVMPQEVRVEVAKRFPHSQRFGIFEVFWKQ
jgi:hypothetical protein